MGSNIVLVKKGCSVMNKVRKIQVTTIILVISAIIFGMIFLIVKYPVSNSHQIKLQQPPRNTIFTEETFQGIVGIRKDLWDIEITDRETVETLCNLLAGAELKKWTNGKLPYRGKYCSDIYELVYENGQKKKFVLSPERMESDELCYKPSEDIASVFLNFFYKIRKERGETNQIRLSQKPQNSVFTEKLFQELMAVKCQQIEITDKVALEEWCNTLAGLTLEEYEEKEEKTATEVVYGFSTFLLKYENGETKEFVLSRGDVLRYEEKEYKVGLESQKKILALYE